MERCQRANARIAEGIDLIDSDPQAEEAFRFANHAMWQQRIHSTYARLVRKKELLAGAPVDPLDVPKNRTWRLFQLAFVLLNLPSLTRLDHPERSHETDAVADLLWFATGGGKTEAYLGLTAYTVALRRLQGEIEGRSGDHGIAVLMRYTLRLLTLQQFQRAAALMCACEVIRKADTTKWGTTPFRLGLWVGSKATPNTLKQAAESLRQGNTGRTADVRRNAAPDRVLPMVRPGDSLAARQGVTSRRTASDGASPTAATRRAAANSLRPSPRWKGCR